MTPAFRAAMAGSFQLAISPRKILAMVAASSFSSVTPGRLKATAIGEMYTGMLMAPSGPHWAWELASSSSFRYASEPANWAEPSMMALRPAPEPSGEYCTVAPELAAAKPAFQASMAAPVEEAPMPVRVPVTLAPEAAGAGRRGVRGVV